MSNPFLLEFFPLTEDKVKRLTVNFQKTYKTICWDIRALACSCFWFLNVIYFFATNRNDVFKLQINLQMGHNFSVIL